MPDESPWVVYGVPGWGSTLAEAMLAHCGARPVLEDVTGFDRPGAARQRLLAVNPLAQVPTIITPEGTAVSESGAIALLLSERFPDSGLAPAPGAPERTAFLRLLFRLTSAVYPTFTYADYPDRWVPTEGAVLQARVMEYRKLVWRGIDRDVGQPWALGDAFSAIDIFITVMTRWKPGRAWFAAECPRLHGIAVRGDGEPALGSVVTRNFPDE